MADPAHVVVGRVGKSHGLDGSFVVEDASDDPAWFEPGDGRPLIPFGLGRLTDRAYRRYRCLGICEGESDTLALRDAFAGVVLDDPLLDRIDVIGLPGASSWQKKWRKYVAPYPYVYVIGDGDVPGRAQPARARRAEPAGRSAQTPRPTTAR